ncbi:hypothetical protein [Rugosimonospora africana]|uniref:Uncharacterized protein n=1 Tax=Rugosimonospora africana TaxID=556532 RepID=A0A8J3QQS1_9ACTN|nr:hypothetical protein [Rugosimonospora africana]GIH13955.1 hypothetical protein Raf01_21270 [Rugosimonospora africana]
MPQAVLEPATQLRPRSHTSRARRALGRPAGLIVLAALVPTACHLLRADWVLPPLILVATASLLRGGQTLLDRLMFALMLLLGAACAGGLLLSLWPWGLAPPAVGGLALAVLVVVGTVLGRRPSLPRPRPADALPLLAGLGGFAYLGASYLRADFAGRVNRAMAGEDLGRHFSIFDSIRRLGGYLFLDPTGAGAHVYDGIIRYPQGFHFIAALLDGFLRSSTAPGTPTSAFDHFLGFHTAAYGLFMLSVIWAAGWVGGPLVRTGARPLVLFAFLTPVLLYTDLLANYVSGYPSEILGLSLVAGLVALLARPLPGIRTQLLLVAAVLVAIGFSYYLFLPGAALGTLLWLVHRRRAVLTRPVFTAALAVVTATLALAPVVLGMFVGKAADALSARASIRDSRDLVIALTLAILAGILCRPGGRPRTWLRYGLAAGAMMAAAAVLGGYQAIVDGSTGYYFEKSLHAVEVTLLVGIGALALLVPPPARPASATPRRHLATALPAVLLAVSLVAGLGVVRGDSPFRPRVNAGFDSWGPAWTKGRLSPRGSGAAVATILRDHPPRPGEVTLVFDANGLRQYDLTLFVAVLRRDGTAGVFRALYGQPDNLVDTNRASLTTMLLDIHQPIEAVTMTSRTAEFIQDIRVKHPDLGLRLVDLS